MTAQQAAEIIGCSPGHARHLARTGRIASKRKVVNGVLMYDLDRRSVLRYRDLPGGGRGYPRGRPRKAS